MPTGVYKHHLCQGFQKGNKIWLGKKQTKEHIKKRVKAKKGFSHTQETKKKMSEAKIGRKLSKETKKKISESHKGKVSWMKGKKFPQISDALKGRKIPMKIRKRMSEAKKGKMPKNCTEEWRLKGRLKQVNMKEPTSIEKKVYKELKSRGLLFEKQKLINGHFIVDAYIPSLNLVIEADGDYWHSLPENIRRDKSRNAYLKACGYSLLRLSETEINNGDFKKKLKEIE